MNDLMSKYNELNNMKETPLDYGYQYEKLAAEFTAQGRLSMAEICRRRAEQYRPVIQSVVFVSCDGGDSIPYVSMAAVTRKELTQPEADELMGYMSNEN